MIGSKEIVNIRVDEIVPNRFQPRLSFNEDELKELCESIKIHGIIQPLVLRRLGDKYEIIAGERRYKASCMANLQTVPAIIVDMNDKESAEVALVENIQRKDLTAIEEAQSYKKILDMGYLTQEELALRMGVSQPNIANKLRLLNLAIPVKEALLANKISERHARSLLNITDTNTQIAMLNRIISERLTVRQTDEEINKLLGRNISEEDYGNNTFVNVNEERQNAQSIIKEETPTDIDSLLRPQGVSSINSPVTETYETPVNTFENPSSDSFVSEDKLESFDTSADMPVNPFMEENTFENPSVVQSTVNPFLNTNDEVVTFDVNSDNTAVSALTPVRDYHSAVKIAKDSVTKLQSEGFTVDSEEFDFDDMYQIVIKIKKEKTTN